MCVLIIARVGVAVFKVTTMRPPQKGRPFVSLTTTIMTVIRIAVKRMMTINVAIIIMVVNAAVTVVMPAIVITVTLERATTVVVVGRILDTVIIDVIVIVNIASVIIGMAAITMIVTPVCASVVN